MAIKPNQLMAQYNKDGGGNLYTVTLTERHTISPDGLVQLSQIPSQTEGVRINGFHEVFDIENITSNSFKVIDYNDRVVKFHSSQALKDVDITYGGIGVMRLSAESVYLLTDAQGNVAKTLKDWIMVMDSKVLELKELVATTEKNVEVVNEWIKFTEEKIETLKNWVDTAEENIAMFEEWKDFTEEKIDMLDEWANFMEYQINVINTFGDCGEILLEVREKLPILQDATDKANDLIPKIEPTNNKVATVTSSQLSLNTTNGFYEYTLNHGWNSDKLCFEVYDGQGNPLVNICRVVNANTLLVRNDERCDIKIIGNIGYWGGVS